MRTHKKKRFRSPRLAPRRSPQATTVSRRAFLALEDSLAIPVNNAWNRAAAPVIQEIADRFQRKDINGALEAVEDLDLVLVAEKQERLARFVGMSAVLFGATEFAKAEDTVFAGQPVPLLVENAVNIFKMSLGLATEVVKAEARKFIEEKLREREARMPLQKLQGTFAIDLATAARTAGSANILLSSSLHASRLGSWGFTQEALVRNVAFYRVSEQLDIRTCPVCREMHGKVFSVPTANSKLERWLSVSDPNELKTIATWPNQSEAGVQALKNMSTGDLQGAGWDTPPYHPFCRGILKRTRKRPQPSGLTPRGPGIPVIPVGPITISPMPQLTGAGALSLLEAEIAAERLAGELPEA